MRPAQVEVSGTVPGVPSLLAPASSFPLPAPTSTALRVLAVLLFDRTFEVRLSLQRDCDRQGIHAYVLHGRNME